MKVINFTKLVKKYIDLDNYKKFMKERRVYKLLLYYSIAKKKISVFIDKKQVDEIKGVELEEVSMDVKHEMSINAKWN